MKYTQLLITTDDVRQKILFCVNAEALICLLGQLRQHFW